MTELTVSVRKIAGTIAVSREMLADTGCDVFAILAQHMAVSARQGGKCLATTTRRRRCRRGWRVIVGEHGYCRQHAKMVRA